MIKVYKLKTLLKIVVLIILTISIIMILKNIIDITNKTKMASSNNVSSYKILVDVEDSKLFLFENDTLVKTYKCSGGKWSTPSPIGTWTVPNKAKWGEGFGGSWMGLNVPWGKFGIHGTLEPNSVGWASSHGCIRMNNDEVAQLYKIIPIGTKVTIVDRSIWSIWKRIKRFKIWNVWL